jgi:asparagine synthase (glutamine-hydrolysing)
MSVQFGRWNFDGKPVERNYLEKVNTVLAPYGPDGASCYSIENISIVYHAFHTTRESRRESQPHITASGAVITWDGRMDNREELIRESSDVLTAASTDVAIVDAVYERWGERCFAKLIGDWTLSIWDPHTRSLTLAKDPIGTRHLYYSFDKDQVTWSTILDPLVLFAGKAFALCEEYIAGLFSFFPATHLTPYVGIHSVPPSSFVVLRRGKHTVTKYWDFDASKRIHYHTDAEYEEHFRAVFGEAVRRRLRSDSPILAELSGGMDSSSIVCMADTIIARGAAETPRLDTVSYYDDSEPNWNERPYFTKVEEKRGRTGMHIDVSMRAPYTLEADVDRFVAIPGSSTGRQSETGIQFGAGIKSQCNRVVLSGIGGDEVTGGVPTPTLELADLLARARFARLAHQLKIWALNKRKPWFHLFFEAVRGFFPPSIVGVPKYKRPVSWLNQAFVRRNRFALQGYERRLSLLGPLPTFQDDISTLEALQRQLGCEGLPLEPVYEKNYPYLDRGFLEFMYAVPPEQVLRPGQRRSLMRRALAGIVPDELLNRKRKAYVSRSPMKAISSGFVSFMKTNDQIAAAALGIIDQRAFSQALERSRCGQEVPLVSVMRTLCIESWLRGYTGWSHSQSLNFDESRSPLTEAQVGGH